MYIAEQNAWSVIFVAYNQGTILERTHLEVRKITQQRQFRKGPSHEQDLVDNSNVDIKIENDFEAEEEKAEDKTEVGNVAAPEQSQDFIENSDDDIRTENELEAEEEKIEEEYEDQTEVSEFNMVYEISSSSAFTSGVDYTTQS